MILFNLYILLENCILKILEYIKNNMLINKHLKEDGNM